MWMVECETMEEHSRLWSDDQRGWVCFVEEVPSRLLYAGDRIAMLRLSLSTCKRRVSMDTNKRTQDVRRGCNKKISSENGHAAHEGAQDVDISSCTIVGRRSLSDATMKNIKRRKKKKKEKGKKKEKRKKIVEGKKKD